MVPTGDPETDARRMRQYVKPTHVEFIKQILITLYDSIQEELQRLQRNKERRHAREKQKSLMTDNRDGSPDAANSPAPSQSAPKGATQRKCANCGQVGHIKTNKKYAICTLIPQHIELSQGDGANSSLRLCPLLNGTMRPEDGGNATAFMMGAPAP